MPTPSHKRILVIKLKQPGDVLVSTPVIAALKAAWPESHLTYLVPKGTEDMVSGHPGLNGLLVVDRRGQTWGQALRFIRDLRRQRFDLVLELSGGDRGAFYSLLTGAGERLGFAHPRQPFWQRHLAFTRLLPRPPVKMHLVDQNLAAVRALGIEPVNPRLQFFWDAAVEQKVQDLLTSLGPGRQALRGDASRGRLALQVLDPGRIRPGDRVSPGRMGPARWCSPGPRPPMSRNCWPRCAGSAGPRPST